MNKNLEKFIEKHKNENVEIECRFNEFEKLGVSFDTFSNVIKKLSENKEFTKSRNLHTQVYALKHKVSQQQYRFTKYTNKPGTLENKTRIAFLDIKEYNIRIAASTERTMIVTNAQLKTEYNVTNIREKIRVSFYNDKISIDLTNVLQNQSQRLYEIECELKKHDEISYFVETIKYILSLVQNSKVIITNSEKEKLLQQYATLCDLKFPKFIGPLPLTINKTQFDNGILSCNYAITDKADGLRKLLYVSNSGDALLIGRSNGKTLVSATIYIGNGYVHLKNSLYDGELIDDTFYIFDCLYINGKNVQQLNLIERLHNIKIKTSASVKSPSHLKMRIKSFFYRNIEIIGPTLKSVTSSSVYKHAYNVWDEKESKPYTLDGLVFTPVNAPYINNQIYKWKPTDTIDFFVLKVNKNANVETWILHIAGFDKKGNYKHYDFRGFDGRGSFSYKKDRKTLITKNTIPFALGTIQIANNTAEKYRTNTVIEFKYIKATKKFVPLQTREDKNFANGILAVNDAYFSITNPITHSGLKAGKYIYCGRKYHNAIKNHLIQKYVKKSNVLDIGVGAGGNIMKYVHANVKSLTGVDIVPVQYEFNPNKMQFFHVKNTNFYNISNILKNAKTKVFDNITCFFAIHYFFKNDKYLENLYNNVNKSLKKGGYFICTFMDEKNVTKLLNSKANYNSNVFSLQRNNEKIKVMLKGTKYFETKASSEYLVDIKRFMRFFPNFSIVERNGFESYKNQFSNEYIMMNNEEKKFSHLNISFVLQKKM